MALKSSREGLRKELVDYLGNIIIDDNLRNEIIKVVGDNFVTSESLNETVNNLTMQITTESGERVEADTTLQNNITAEATAREGADTTLQNNITAEAAAREGADTTLQNNINAETTARQEAIANLAEMIGTSGLQIDLLWTNASPSSEFAPQTINLDLSSYKLVLVYFKRITSNNEFFVTSISQVGFINGSVSVTEYGYSFRYYEVTSNGIIFKNGGVSGDAVRSDINIPIRICGIK